MGKHNKSDWTAIVKQEDLLILKWFYQSFLRDIFAGTGSDEQKIKWQQWYKDWDLTSWLCWYEQPLRILNNLSERAFGMPVPSPTAKPSEAKEFFIELLKRIKDVVDKGFEINRVKEIAEYLIPNLMQFRLQLFAGLNQISCRVKFHKTVTELIEKSKTDDTDAMLKLIKLDKIFIEFEPIKKRIRYAALFHQTWFLDDLASAIKSDPFKEGLSKKIDDLAIYLFWEMGFYNTTLKAFNEFLWEIGIQRFVKDKALGKHLERIGLKKYSRNHEKNL